MITAPTPYLSDDEVDGLCAGLHQNAAKIRYLRDTLKLPVATKPNGRPLVWRHDVSRGEKQAAATAGPKWSKA